MDGLFGASIPGPNGTTLTAPIPYAALKRSLEVGYNSNTNIRHFAGSDVGNTLVGFDIEFAELTLTRMLGLNVSFILLQYYPELYLGLRGGLCHMAITAIETDALKTLCTSSCPSTFSIIGDYGSSTTSSDVGGIGHRRRLHGYPGCKNTSTGCNGFSPVTLEAECCLQFGQEYMSQGFALMSFVQSSSTDILPAVFNTDVGNAALAMILIALSAAFLFFALESRKNPALASLPRAALWTMQKFFLDEDKKVRTQTGRALKQIYMAANLCGVCVITSIIAAKLTAALLSVVLIDNMSQVTGTLCFESAYPKLADFVLGGTHPVSVTSAPIDQCVQMLLDGSVQAVITDETHLQWFANYYALPNLHLSPTLAPNPFAMAFRADQTPDGLVSQSLMQYINPAVIATRTDPDWVPIYNAIFDKYFSASNSLTSTGPAEVALNKKLYIPVLVLASLICAVGLLSGELFPRLIPTRHRPAIFDHLAAEVSRDWHMERNEEAENELFLGEVRLGLLKRIFVDGHLNEKSIRYSEKTRRMQKRISQRGLDKGENPSAENGENGSQPPRGESPSSPRHERRSSYMLDQGLLQKLLEEMQQLREEVQQLRSAVTADK